MDEVLVAWVVLPLYTAVISREPTASALVTHCAWFPESATPAHTWVAPSRNVTVPVGVPPATVAVKVTDWPEIDGLALEVTVVVVAVLVVKVAVTVAAAEIETTHVPVPLQPPPLQLAR